jgi:hypothetical protein
MPRKLEDQIAALEQRMEQERQRMRDLRAQADKQARRDETRRKIILGGALLRMAEGFDERRRTKALAQVHKHVTRPKDRAFLGLLPFQEPGADEDAQSADGGRTVRLDEPQTDTARDATGALPLSFPEPTADPSAPEKAASQPRSEEHESRSRAT